MNRLCAAILVSLTLVVSGAAAQGRPDVGGHEFEFWTGGGHATSGSTSSDGVWNAGARLGWVLTGPHGPGFLRGRFEYAVDVVPVFLVFQPANTAYGFGIYPYALKWNFETDHRIVPYFEVGGGVVFSNTEIPTGTSKINFTPTGAFGLHVLREKFNWSIEVRYMHISSASLVSPNPGINTVQVRIGLGWFTHGKRGDHAPRPR
jgi:hypothetical protein